MSALITCLVSLVRGKVSARVVGRLLYVSRSWLPTKLAYLRWWLSGKPEVIQKTYDVHGMLTCHPRPPDVNDSLPVKKLMVEAIMDSLWRTKSGSMFGVHEFRVSTEDIVAYARNSPISHNVDVNTSEIDLYCGCYFNPNLESLRDGQRHLGCRSIQFDRNLSKVISITMRDGTRVTPGDFTLWPSAVGFAAIGLYHFGVFHGHNYVHFHFTDAVVAGVFETMATSGKARSFLEPHTRYVLQISDNGLSGLVTDGHECSPFQAPISGAIVDASVFNDAVGERTMQFLGIGGVGQPDGMAFGCPFTLLGAPLDTCPVTAATLPYTASLVQAYRHILSFVGAHLACCTPAELLQHETCKAYAAKLLHGDRRVVEASLLHFLATFVWLGGYMHSMDHNTLAWMDSKGVPLYGVLPWADVKARCLSRGAQEGFNSLYTTESRTISHNMHQLAISGQAVADALTHHTHQDANLARRLEEAKAPILRGLQCADFPLYMSVCI